MIRLALVLSICLLKSFPVMSADINEKRAKYNYQMFCQGCHTQDGVGGRGVPRLKGFVGHFPKSQKGREYLVRVPGSANSVLDNEQLAEVLNWMIMNFGEASIDKAWRPYELEEVGEYRKDPLMEVEAYRKALLVELDVQGLNIKVNNE